jgi:hypothetical protein
MRCRYADPGRGLRITSQRIRSQELGFRFLCELAGRSEEVLAHRAFIGIVFVPTVSVMIMTMTMLVLVLMILVPQMQFERRACNHRCKAHSHSENHALAGRKTHLEPSGSQNIFPIIKHISGRDLRAEPADGG